MRLILQKVSRASVSVDGSTVASIGRGYLLFIGFMQGDTPQIAEELAQKVVKLRLFDGDDGKINDTSLIDIQGEALVVSQFTLAGRTEKGNRPDYTAAMPPQEAQLLYEKFKILLHGAGVSQVQSGTFGAHMAVELVNDGPVTLILER